MKNLKAELDKEFSETMARLSAAENGQLNMMKTEMNQKQADRYAENEGEVDQLFVSSPKVTSFQEKNFMAKKSMLKQKGFLLSKQLTLNGLVTTLDKSLREFCECFQTSLCTFLLVHQLMTLHLKSF